MLFDFLDEEMDDDDPEVEEEPQEEDDDDDNMMDVTTADDEQIERESMGSIADKVNIKLYSDRRIQIWLAK